MMHEMRRKDRQISEEEAKEILKKGIYGILTTVGSDGVPYGVPVNYVYDGDAVYFHCAKGCGKKLENIAFSDKVGFTVVGGTKVLEDKFAMEYESVIVSGTVAEVTDRKDDIFEELLLKYCAAYMDSGKKYMEKAGENAGVYKITIQELTGKARR